VSQSCKTTCKKFFATNQSNSYEFEGVQLVLQYLLHRIVKNGWTYYQSSLYFISSETKSWTESRRYCTERAADLIIINNREEQNISGVAKVWIGLTDIEVEGRWKWVDGSTLTSRFWASGQPNNYKGKEEDCALIHSPGWADFPCNDKHKWICEKSVLK
uniref:CD209 antigen-like protein C n=1 Tax=Sinocyclocheilus grahami TaxID=75366 RepID=A0A672K2Z2_SINGR